jgi:hypothetical protein
MYVGWVLGGDMDELSPAQSTFYDIINGRSPHRQSETNNHGRCQVMLDATSKNSALPCMNPIARLIQNSHRVTHDRSDYVPEKTLTGQPSSWRAEINGWKVARSG